MPRLPILMPKMSMTMEEGTVVEWHIDVGASIKSGDVIAIVTTDKVDMDVEATATGTLVEIVAGPDTVVPVGVPICWVDSEADDLLGDLFASPAQPAQSTPPAGQAAAATPLADQAVSPDATGERVRAVPLARRLAADAGLDLSTIAATGPHRTVRARDVREALAAHQAQPVASQEAAPRRASSPAPGIAAPSVQADAGELLGDGKERRIRVATAKAMVPSAAIPQFTCYRVIDLTEMARARKASLKGVSWTSVLLRAYALVLRQYPNLNGYWADQGVKGNSEIGISLAVDTPTGLLAPVVPNPDRSTLKLLDAQVKSLAETVKSGKIDPNLFAGGTGTLSNLGGMGVDRFNSILTPPQATALSVGTVGLKPFFDEDGSVIGRMACEVGLTIDHRAADGADAARALQTLQDFLHDPIALLA